jgi:hypothetical protein
MWNDLNGLHVCVNAVMVNGSMVNVEWFEWVTCMCECCNSNWVNGKCGMIWMVYIYVWML